MLVVSLDDRMDRMVLCVIQTWSVLVEMQYLYWRYRSARPEAENDSLLNVENGS